MASLGDLALRFTFSFLLAIMTGVNVWQYISLTGTQTDREKPRMKWVFVFEMAVTALAGLYLILSTAILLA